MAFHHMMFSTGSDGWQVGETSVMALVRLQIVKPDDRTNEDGKLEIEVDVTPMSGQEARPGMDD
eukprot:scaffold84720_cov43-Prasinocladus_malaysianus.AAC.1